MAGKDTEDKAISFVVAVEEAEGRDPARDTRYKDAPTDIESLGRIIEVKAASKTTRGNDVWLETTQYEAAHDRAEAFWLYLVENVEQGDPSQFRLLRFGGSQLQQLLEKAKQKTYYELPLPVAAYDAAAASGTSAVERAAAWMNGVERAASGDGPAGQADRGREGGS